MAEAAIQQAETVVAEPRAATKPPVLTVNNIEVVYDEVILVLRGVSLSVPEGEIVALLGPNGAGKSTTLKAISGLLRTEDGEVTRGNVNFMGEEIANLAPEEIVRRGIFQVMEGRRIIEDMTVIENLRLGAFTRRDNGVKRDIDMVFDFFPRLRERTGLAGYLSGGEQQMLAISRALMLRPRLLLLDEPSFGLAPLVVAEIFRIMRSINREDRVSMLLVEQNASLALDLADHAYLLETGRVAMSGPSEQVRADESVRHAYLGR